MSILRGPFTYHPEKFNEICQLIACLFRRNIFREFPEIGFSVPIDYLWAWLHILIYYGTPTMKENKRGDSALAGKSVKRKNPLFFQFVNHVFDCSRKRLKAVLADPEDLFGIDIEIMMGDNIAETLDACPIDLGIFQ